MLLRNWMLLISTVVMLASCNGGGSDGGHVDMLWGSAFVDDDWSLGATKSLLGATLLSLRRYNEAETVLLDARNDLASHGTPQPAVMRATLTRLVQLYAAWGKRDRAETYRALLGS